MVGNGKVSLCLQILWSEIYTQSLQRPQGTQVKVWVMDEARFGLYTDLRRVWVPKGSCPVVERQTKYAWDYLYGSLEVTRGQAYFVHLPTFPA